MCFPLKDEKENGHESKLLIHIQLIPDFNFNFGLNSICERRPKHI
jgi:hypothetical protein